MGCGLTGASAIVFDMNTARTCIRLSKTAHLGRPWRIHDIAPDFRVEDVWLLPTRGGPDDFPLLLELCADADAYNHSSFIVRTMMSIRWKLGAFFGWDDTDTGFDPDVRSLRERLPLDLLEGPTGPETPNAPSRPVYLTENEFVDELANKTVHALGHIGWVRTDDGDYRGQMAVLVKPNGLFGQLYMAGIKPIRYFLVYPALMRIVAADWNARRAARAQPSSPIGEPPHADSRPPTAAREQVDSSGIENGERR